MYDFGDDYRTHKHAHTSNTTTHIGWSVGKSCCTTIPALLVHTHTHIQMSHHPWKNPDNSSNCICVSHLVISLIRIHLVYDDAEKSPSMCVSRTQPHAHAHFPHFHSLLLSTDGNHSIVCGFARVELGSTFTNAMEFVLSIGRLTNFNKHE